MRRLVPIHLMCFLQAALSAQQFTVQTHPLPAGLDAFGVSTGDVNGDGAPDVALSGFSKVAVVLGDGSGGLGLPALIQPVFFGSLAQLADGNGDGNLDFWAVSALGQVRFFGDGSGGFSPGTPPGQGTGSFAIGDVNEDGMPDFVTEVGTTSVAVSLNDGAGNFGPPVTVAQATLTFSFTSLRLVDLDSDGHVDILVRGLPPFFTAILGDGTGSFDVRPTITIPDGGSSWTLLDLSGDGLPDLIVSAGTAGSERMEVWLNNGLGAFAFGWVLSAPVMSTIAAADLDADGRQDLIGLRTNNVVVAMGDGNGDFSAATFTNVPGATGLALSDFDRDGKTDILTRQYPPLSLAVLRNSLPTPLGIQSYGIGTPTCAGTITMWGSPEPAIGTTSFRIACSNAPSDCQGLLAVGSRHWSGWDPLGLGITLHLGLAVPIGTMHSDGAGAATFALPIPPLPMIAGWRLHTQSIWLGDPGLGNTCSPGLHELATSRGLTITLQP